MSLQTKFLHDFNDKNRIKMNPALFRRTDEDLIAELENIILSCQRDNKYFKIKVEGFEVITDYNQINQTLYNYYENSMRNKNKSKRKDNQYEYINLKESDIILLVVKYHIWAVAKAKPTDPNDEHVEVIISVPRLVDDYYFRIGGVTYSSLYQIVDGSTYNNATSNSKYQSVTLKIVFMATRSLREINVMRTTKDEEIKLALFKSRIFNKTVPAMKYMLAKFGFYGCMGFLGLQHIYVTDYDLNNDDFYTFQKGTKENALFISAPKMLVDNDNMTQSMICTLYKSLIPGMKYQLIFDPDFWMRSLGADFNNTTNEKLLAVLKSNDQAIPDTIEKGISVLDSFESIYDISTKKNIKLPEEQKADMYCILRWMIREFNQLRLRDNLDIGCKRIRYAEYIASLYAMKMVKGIYRVADTNRRASLAGIKKAIVTAPNYLLKVVTKCKLVNYRNMVNDMDSLVPLKYTYKGVSGLGESNSNSIPAIYRAVQPSHLGRVDLDSSSNSDPGITGTLCPFSDLYEGGFFADMQEPNFWESEYAATLADYHRAAKLTEVLTFQEEVLNMDVTERKEQNAEMVASMQRLISPMIFYKNQEDYDNGY